MDQGGQMSQKFSRDELVARMVRAGELEVAGEAPEECQRPQL
jgi:hypothetical protein